MLVSDVITRVKDITGDAEGTRWDNSRLIREVDTAQREFCKATRILRNSIDLIVHSGQSNYQVPNCYLLNRVLYNDTPLKLTSTNNLDAAGTKWELDEGIPTHIVFNHLNRSMIRLYPTPKFETPTVFDITTANKLNITYIRYPRKLTVDTDELEIPDIYLDILVYFITGTLFRSDLDSLNRQFGAEQFILYSSAIKEIKNEVTLDYKQNPEAYQTQYRRL